MQKIIFLITILFLFVFLSAGNGFSYTLGTNITIGDENYGGDWHGEGEDQEVEPGMQHGQQWDLEGFFLSGSILSMVGGYNFVAGEANMSSGDIFIDIDGNAVYGDIDGNTNGNRTVTDTFGYDFVIDLDFENFLYDVLKLVDGSTTVTSYYAQNQGSNPWQYGSGGVTVSTGNTFSYTTGVSDSDLSYEGLTGGSHNVVSGIDLSFLDHNTEFTSHFTMECGNDNLMGNAVIPNPEPATMILFGLGLIGLAGFGRRKMLSKD